MTTINKLKQCIHTGEKLANDMFKTEYHSLAVKILQSQFKVEPVCHELMNGITDTEKSIYKLLETNDIVTGIANCSYYTLPTPAFLTADEGFKAVLLPAREKRESGNARVIKLAHEAGHAIDFALNFNYDADAFKTKSFSGTMELEIVAWIYAEHLLKAIGGFDDWREFDQWKHDCLLSYAWNDEETLNMFLAEESEIFKRHERTYTTVPA